MVLRTKERIVANKQFATERFIRSTHPVLYLPLYRKDGSQFTSSDAYGHLATVTGATWGKQGRTFDGIDDEIIVPSLSTYFPTNRGTMEAWLNHTAQAGARAIIDWAGDKPLWYLSDNAFQVLWTGATGMGNVVDGQYTNTFAVSSGVSHHLLFTWDGVAGTNAIYIDSVLQEAQGSGVVLTALVNGNEVIGHYGGNFTQGVFGELRVYNRPLGISEISNNFLATKWRYQ